MHNSEIIKQSLFKLTSVILRIIPDIQGMILFNPESTEFAKANRTLKSHGMKKCYETTKVTE